MMRKELGEGSNPDLEEEGGLRSRSREERMPQIHIHVPPTLSKPPPSSSSLVDTWRARWCEGRRGESAQAARLWENVVV